MMYFYNRCRYFSKLFFDKKIIRCYTEKVLTLDYMDRLRECFRLEEQNNFVVPVFKRALLYGNNIAIRDQAGEYNYFQMYANSKRLAEQLANLTGSGSSSRIGFFYTNDALCTLTLWACWMCGQVAMPLNPKCSSNYDNLLSFLRYTNIRVLISTEEFALAANKLCNDLEIPSITLDHMFVQNKVKDFSRSCQIYTVGNRAILSGILTNDFYSRCNALLLNTSDNKTAILSHRNLSFQFKTGLNIWQLTENDRILLAFPGNYINGYMNTVQLGLRAGAGLHIQQDFDGHTCWSTLLGINTAQKDRPNVFMSEPQGFRTLIEIYDKIFAKNSTMVEFIKNSCQRNYRLMTSSFEPMSVYILKRWLEITGHYIWQSYYLTESGITMSTCDCNTVFASMNTLNYPSLPETNKFLPLPYNKVRIIDQFNKVILEIQGTQKHVDKTPELITKIGMLMISGPGVFKKYMNSNEPTSDANDEVFLTTSDIVSYENEGFVLLGRCYTPKQPLILPEESDFHNRLHLHPSIDFAKIDGKGIAYTLKTNRKMSLKSLQLFCAIIMKDLYYNALVFHSSATTK